MNLDEGIRHAEDVARNNHEAAIYLADEHPTQAEKCEECAREHEQLAEWLKELKAYKEQDGDEELDFVPEHKKIPCIMIIGNPCGDTISRAYIEPIIEELENICVDGDEHVLDLLADVKNAPPVTPQPIECEERKSGNCPFYAN